MNLTKNYRDEVEEYKTYQLCHVINSSNRWMSLMHCQQTKNTQNWSDSFSEGLEGGDIHHVRKRPDKAVRRRKKERLFDDYK